jgi:pilus assembly protein Flp/PilA
MPRHLLRFFPNAIEFGLIAAGIAVAIIAVEFGLIAAGVAVVIIAVVQSVGCSLVNTFTSVQPALK